LAKRCLYCGGSSWGPLRWLVDGQFCSREHRDSYNERLKRIVSDLAQHQNQPADAEGNGASPAYGAVRAAAGASKAAGPYLLIPCTAVPGNVHAVGALEALLRDLTVVRSRNGRGGIAVPDLSLAAFKNPAEEIKPANGTLKPLSAASAIAPSAQPKIFLPCASHGPAGFCIWPALGIASAQGNVRALEAGSGPLPLTFESRAKIGRWGLRLKFGKPAGALRG